MRTKKSESINIAKEKADLFAQAKLLNQVQTQNLHQVVDGGVVQIGRIVARLVPVARKGSGNHVQNGNASLQKRCMVVIYAAPVISTHLGKVTGGGVSLRLQQLETV